MRNRRTITRIAGTAALAALSISILSLGAGAQTLARTDPTTPAISSDDPPTENKELARALQRELKRLGCLDGEANGIWGERSRAAFKSFVRQAKLSVDGDEPNVSVLDAASATRARVCSVAAKGEETPAETRRQTPPQPPRAEPVKAKETKPEKRIEKEELRPAAKPKQAREPRIEREPRRVERERPYREPRQARATPEHRESPNSGKRICFGAARNEIVTCP
jgi:peptidoglycan hydrolase-like protein with peptidoglycan-binding domain